MVIQVVKCLLIKILQYYRRANYFENFEDIQNFTLNKKFCGKILRLWTTREIYYRTYLARARGDKLCDRFEDVSVIRTIARHHIYKDILCPPLERFSRAEKNPTMINIVFLWLLTKRYLTIAQCYRWTCASNHFSTVQSVLKKGGTISYDVVTGPHQYSRNLEKLLRDQQHSYLSANLRPFLAK